MVQKALSEPVTVQMRLPVDVLSRLRDESDRDMIPLSFLVRRCLVRTYGRGEAVSPSSTESTETVHNVHPTDADSN